MGSATATTAEAELENRVSEPPLPREHDLRVLKHADLFGVFDAFGDIQGALHAVGPSTGADGLFLDDTRVLSRYLLQVGSAPPILLSSTISRDNTILVVDATTKAFEDRAGRLVEASQIHIRRRRFLWDRCLHEAIAVRNYGTWPIETALVFELDADFRDLFEIRGVSRRARGALLLPSAGPRSISFAYHGLDQRTRRTSIAFSLQVERRPDGRFAVPVRIPPTDSCTLLITVSTGVEPRYAPTETDFARSLRRAKRSRVQRLRSLRRITTNDQQFDAWLDRATADLALLITDLPTGPYPYAGIPWFSVPFGRDAVITAWQLLWVEPGIARGVLQYLAARQSQEISTFRDAQPGKIMHETRKGEMALLGEVPFESYYGGVDTTPLFVGLAAAYHKRTGDLRFIEAIWPSIVAALDWIDRFGDMDGDGFLEYQRGEDSGLHNQGWKDSQDSVFHADGRLAEGPIALIEVQGYVYLAKRGAARLAEQLGDHETALRLKRESEALRVSIDQAFWSEELGGYGLALDGRKRLCAVRASNVGHLLAARVVPEEKVRQVSDWLLGPGFFTGWGIRTVAEGEARYNPMSYHNGSIWPHDCSLAAAGLSLYGLTQPATRLLTGMFDAARHYANSRLPELFCGFRRRAGAGPVAYPSACTPQAWASGAVFLMLQACLGLSIDANRRIIGVAKPALPPWLEQVVIRDLPVADAKATIRFTRTAHGIEASMARSEGEVSLLLRGG
jgi:glycogen debranching enzyme